MTWRALANGGAGEGHCRARRDGGRRQTSGGEGGFTLIELLVVVAIMPLIIGAISVALIAVLGNETTVSNSLTGSGDEQVVSANFVGDVQGSQWVTTFSSSTTMCGTGTLVFSLSPDKVPAAQITNVISYVKVPQASGSTDTLFRNVCSGATVKTSTAISHNVPSTQQVAIQPASVQSAAATGWVAAQGTTSVNLSISEPPTNYLYSLSATPRLVAAPSSGPNAPVSPVLPLELLGGGGATCTPPPTVPDLTIGGTTTIEVGSAPSWNGAIGVASPCAGSISMPNSGKLKGTINTADPNLNSVSAGGGAVYPTSETYVPGGITNPFSSLAPPNNPSISGLGTGSCSGSGPYTCSTGLYSSPPSALSVNTAVITFDPSIAPNPNVIVFNQPVSIHNSEQVTFEGGSPVSQVTYWFRGGLTTSGASSVTFGPATYIFGDSSSPPATALSIGNGSTISANNDQGVLFYVEAGPATFSGNASTPIAGSSLYDGIALWDASTSPITIANSSSITGFGGVYDSSPSCGAVACVQFSGNVPFAAYFLIAYTMSSPSGRRDNPDHGKAMKLPSLVNPDDRAQSARWCSRRTSWRDHRSESGDTLVELLIALVVISLTAVALIGGFSTSLSASAEHRSLASIDTVLKSFVEATTYQLSLQTQPPATTPQFTACATASTYSSLTLSQNNYTANIAATTTSPIIPAVEYWNGSSWTTSCDSSAIPPQPQLVNAVVTGHGATESLQFAVSDPAYSSPAPAFTSASSVNEVAGVQFNFPVTATGGPAPALSASGLPTGVTFVDNGGGSGTLAGTISVAAGTYTITFTATNSVGSTTQAFTLAVASFPQITSAPSDTVPPGSAFTFAVTATGTPQPALSASGLPTGVTFVDNGGGSGTLAGLNSVASGTYAVTFTATNDAGMATQPFTLVVSAASVPTFTSANSATEPYHTAFSFTVQTTGAPTPTLTTSALPLGVTFHDNGNNTGTLSGTNSVVPFSYGITFTATNIAGTATQTFTLVVQGQSTPTITFPSVSSPEKPGHNATATFTLTGTGFVNGLTVTGNGSANVLSYTYLSSSQITVTVRGSGGQGAPGSFTVTNPDGGAVSSANGSFVNG